MKEKRLATLAAKIAGKKKRDHWSRDLRGRFSRASETSRSPGDFSKEGKASLRKIRPSSFSAKVRASKKKQAGTRIR